MSSTQALRPVERSVQDRLAANGVRFTGGRRLVLRALQGADGPRSAAELQQILAGGVPVSSLYRTLTLLEDCGVVVPHHGLRGVTRYELAEWIRGHHHHLVCTNCGAVDDIELDEGTEEGLSKLVAAVADNAGLMPEGHTLEIEGRCRRC
ncbi:MAG: transcriptional repressor [Acidimicrobiia bacterium]